MRVKRITLLCLLLLTALIIVSCGDNKNPAPTDTTQNAEITTIVDTTSEPKIPITDVSIVESGATQYKIVRSANAPKALVDATVSLKDAFSSAYGVQPELSVDTVTSSDASYAYEIIIGDADREEAQSIQDTLHYNDIAITMIGTKLVIGGGNDEATIEAINYFIEKYVTSDKLAVKSNLYDYKAGAYTPIKLNGVSLEEYSIAYNTGYRDALKELVRQIGVKYGIKMTAVKDTASTADLEIVLGSREKSGDFSGLGQDDFNIEIKDNDVHIYGGSAYAIDTACARFIDALGKGADLSFDDIALTYTLPDRQEYINDISKLALHWELYHETPEWMLDFDEKYAAFNDPDGRLMSMLHRGEVTYYPENSIEGLISAIQIGADMVEIDIRLTKDGVPVLMHDAKLNRTTNFEKMKGKNGLPNSEFLENWTYDQLMQLNLLSGNGGNGAKETPYKIPTFEEVIKVAANRIFLLTDVKPDSKNDRCISYVNDIWPLLVEYDAYLSLPFFWWEEMIEGNYAVTKEYRKLAEQATGKATPVIINKASYNDIYPLHHFFGFSMVGRLSSDFSKYSYKTYLSDHANKFADLKGRVRVVVGIYGTNSAYPENKESFEFYEVLYEAGINFPFVEKGFLLCQYIALTASPTEYEK